MPNRSLLFSPLRIGTLDVPNRVFMAPLTRNRAQPDGTPSAIAQTYYAQRASAGLIVSEGTQISALGKGYLDTPGIYDDAHVAGWRRITDAVHAAGGRIFCQIWHVGRISNVSLLPGGAAPVAPSAIPAQTRTFTATGFEPTSAPVALSLDGIAATLADYAHATRQAKAAGFDGVEIHGANGYLIDQFLQDKTNHRNDAYGGPVANRTRFLTEVVDAVVDAWEPGRVGLRLSPLGQSNDIGDSDREGLFTPVFRMLSGKGLAYLHVVEGMPGLERSAEEVAMLRRLRDAYDGTYVANGSFDAASAAAAIAGGRADAVSFGRSFIANPDLPERFRLGAALNAPDRDTFYGGGEKGYVDYPFLTDRYQAA